MSWQGCVIEREEIIGHYDLIGGVAQIILMLAKGKGAPIKGTIIMRVDVENYDWRFHKHGDNYIINWRANGNG